MGDLSKAVPVYDKPPDYVSVSDSSTDYIVRMKTLRESQSRNHEMFVLELAVCEAALRFFELGDPQPGSYGRLVDAVKALRQAREAEKRCQQP